MPRKKKTEASVYEKPEAENAAPVATTSPKGAPKRKRGRKAKAGEAATTAPRDATVATTSDATSDATKANGGNVSEVNSDDATERAPAPGRKKATRKATKKPGANTGADGGLTMAALADLFLKHLEDSGRSRGTTFSYSLDLGLAIKHFGEKTKVTSITAKKVTNFYESDIVTKTRTGKAKAQPTILKSRRVLRLALVWAAQQGIIPEAPLPDTKK